MSVTKPLAPEVKGGFLFPYNNWANRIATHRFVVDIPSGRGSASDRALAEFEPKLALLRDHPVRILWGGQDFCFNRHYYERWVKLLPNAKAHYLEAAGHYVLEDAAEECLRAVQAFIV
jgi:haloalkane dehalogenase